MKLAGIVRRIDELGRIVIPKEIRKTLHIKNGENLEIFTQNDNIVLKKYSELGNLKELSDTITKSLNQLLKENILITDTDKFISIEGKLKNKYLKQEISEQILKYINERKTVILKNQALNFTKDSKETGNIIISPIISNGDALGSSIIITDKNITENIIYTINIITTILSKYIET